MAASRIGHDYLALADCQESVVWHALQRGLDASCFVSWQWQINHQIRTVQQAQEYVDLRCDEEIGRAHV